MNPPANAPKGLILIVDDTPTNLEVISATLADAGLECAISISGDRALQQIEKFLPDLILLDVMMPGIDGFETCRRLKMSDRTRQIPIIFMTALADTESKVKALELGAVDFISKPFHESEILARVKTHLQLYHLTQNLEAQVAQKEAELIHSQLHLIQNEKMSALGNLVAGIAHEINHPIGCIVGNVTAVQESMNDLFDIIELYQQAIPQPSESIAEKLDNVDLDYLRQDLPELVKAMKDSSDRIKAISRSLRTFSRADQEQKQKFDLHEGLDSTILILRHRLKANEQRPEIEVITDYDLLPEVECFPGQLNQVFMNILANAIDALEEGNQGRSYADIKARPNCITIRTLVEDREVQVSIADNGCGMSETVRTQIFDHLFTTKAVGEGTGLGLAIAQQIIKNHNGSIIAHSEINQGTEFVIRLPR
jgi:signal transduction histidine kinase